MAEEVKVTQRLVDAMGSATLVRVSRSPRNADRVDGFVVAVGTKWVLIEQTRDGGFFDGLVAVRLHDVVTVKRDPTFASRFAQAQPEWPATAPIGIDLAGSRGLLESLSRVSPLLGIEQERRHHSAMTWIGVVDEIRKGWLWLHEVRPDATWHRQPRGYKLSRITKVAISDRYQTALAAIAGTRPPLGSPPDGDPSGRPDRQRSASA